MRQVRRPGGVTLMIAMFVTVGIAIVGMAFVAQQRLQYEAIAVAAQDAAASVMAEAGLEDALAKLAADVDFPPPGDDEQKVFAYSERFQALDGRDLGSYAITLDFRWRARPTGSWPSPPSAPWARRSGPWPGAPSGPRWTCCPRATARRIPTT